MCGQGAGAVPRRTSHRNRRLVSRGTSLASAISHSVAVVPRGTSRIGRAVHPRSSTWNGALAGSPITIPRFRSPVELSVCPHAASHLPRDVRARTRSIACRRFRRRRPKCWRRGSPNAAAGWRPTRASPWPASAATPSTGDGSAPMRLGDRILAELAADGVDVASVRRIAGCVSPSAAILVDDHGERLVCAYNDPALDADAVVAAARSRRRRCQAVLADVRWPEGAAAVSTAAARTA